MRSTRPRDTGDLTAAARIRDAAIDRYGRDGFTASLRAVASDAGVSGALIVHHFGSKDGLRAACDDHVLALLRETKSSALRSPGNASLLHQLAETDRYAPMTLYIVRSLQGGGRLADVFLKRIVDDTIEYMAIGVETGRIKPSHDPPARAALLARMSLGALVVEATLSDDLLRTDFPRFLREYTDRWAVPTLELYTDGVFADRTLLEQIRPQNEEQ
ncbi:TetR family transcriptional regulator [Rhodococcoides trifolii]|uniref:TetR family transcriptional regulator n=1 Tax=Rhodococcoides trifolii TaxID=908250 RepID=A0A917CNC5_9NOCA|nr:TetR family transcriptional regulator [Rhodococcus trifolii]GGF91888.1 TetR family transcriptional regulator [Rhodococcus trifolii]